MPENANEIYRRASGALRTPSVGDWDTWPFEGELRPRALQPPDPEPVITEGAEHLHWWFIGRPAGFSQLRSSFAEIWDEVLPPTPPHIWRDNLSRVVRAMD